MILKKIKANGIEVGGGVPDNNIKMKKFIS